METEGKNKVNVALVLLVIVLAILCVLFATDILTFNTKKSNKSENQSSQQTNVDDVKPDTNNTIDESKPTIDTKEELMKKLVGTYSYKGEYVDKVEDEKFVVEDDAFEKGKMSIEKLILNIDGTAKAESSTIRGSGYKAMGSWSINENKIIIINDECKPIMIDGKEEYPNCKMQFEYEYTVNNSDVVIVSLNNTSVSRITLVKN